MMRKSAPFILVLAAVVPLAAQDADPPSRVARLNLLSGSVSFRPGSVEEWTAATLNYPLATGDHLWADADSRTEMHVGSTAIRMTAMTAMSILNLDDRAVQLSLTQGALDIRLRHLDENESFEVDTPNVSITLLRPGDYRIDADGDNNVTMVSVRAGDAEVTGSGGAFPVHARQAARLAGTDNVSQEILPMPGMTDFDLWCEGRDRREDQAVMSARYVPRDMVGYEDLDEHGVWTEVPEYGWVWRPRAVEVGWAPYRFGHWAWVEPWGWTWIDDAPWGFAPFHYGRWVVAGGGWAWVPGQMMVGVRPVYAPALVAFVGGGGVGVGVAAWFPLGPHEVYRPAYHVSEVYVRLVNITHVTSVTVINNGNVTYVNQRVPGAVTVVTRETFVSARPVGRSAVSLDERVVMRAQVVGTAAPIPPQRVSVLAHVGPPVAAPPARFVEHTVVARRTPPPPPVSFAVKQEALQANQGRPLEPAQVERIRPAMPPRNPMVRTEAVPAPAMAPRVDRPVTFGPPRNERPANTAPAQPQRVEAPVRNERPVVQERNERPANLTPPAQPQRVEAPPVRNERPAVQEQRHEQKQEDRKAAKKKEKEEKK